MFVRDCQSFMGFPVPYVIDIRIANLFVKYVEYTLPEICGEILEQRTRKYLLKYTTHILVTYSSETLERKNLLENC